MLILQIFLLLQYCTLIAFFCASAATPVDVVSQGAAWQVLKYFVLLLPAVFIIICYALTITGPRDTILPTIYLVVYLIFLATFIIKVLVKQPIKRLHPADDVDYAKYYLTLYTIFAALFTFLVTFDMHAYASIVDGVRTRVLLLGLISLSIGAALLLLSWLYFSRLSLDDIKQRLGVPLAAYEDTVFKSDMVEAEAPDSMYENSAAREDWNLSTFDCRQKWPGLMSGIRDQGPCGSCVFFACVSVLADRYAIKTNEPAIPMSPQYAMDCCNGNPGYAKERRAVGDISKKAGITGCEGTLPHLVLKYLLSEAYPTASGTTTEVCWPYKYVQVKRETPASGNNQTLYAAFVAPHAEGAKEVTRGLGITVACLTACTALLIAAKLAAGPSVRLALLTVSSILLTLLSALCLVIYVAVIQRQTPWQVMTVSAAATTCSRVCADNEDIRARYKFAKWYFVCTSLSRMSSATRIRRIKQEIFERGPVISCFMQYSDFPRGVTTGVYRKSWWASETGGHCISIIGWGADYWIVRNQWGDSWGNVTDLGCYYHAFGQCGIEDNVVAAGW